MVCVFTPGTNNAVTMLKTHFNIPALRSDVCNTASVSLFIKDSLLAALLTQPLQLSTTAFRMAARWSQAGRERSVGVWGERSP